MERAVGTGTWTHVFVSDNPAYASKPENGTTLKVIVGNIWWKAEFNIENYEYIKQQSANADKCRDLKNPGVGECSQYCHAVVRLRAELQPSKAVWSLEMRTSSGMGSGCDGTLTIWSFTKIECIARIILLMCVFRIFILLYTDTMT